ncbi:MAG: metallophosphoesterase [Chryseolinea sp.]
MVKSHRTFVLGDVHGAHRALRQCMERSAFDYLTDHLICLGDVCDGWPETKDCFNELLQIRHLTLIMGNHDLMMLKWIRNPTEKDASWLMQGGQATVNSYDDEVPQRQVNLLMSAHPYFIERDKFFTHAGFNPDKPVETQDLEVFSWDRSLARKVLDSYSNGGTAKLTPYEEVYLGHTPIPFGKPIFSGGVWMMDTGAGWNGPLSMMNVESKEVFSSDNVPSLYPGIKGRGG